MLEAMQMIHSLIYIFREFKNTAGSPQSPKSSNVFLTL